MKSLILFVALLFAVTLTSSSTVTTKATPEHKNQRAVMQFNEPVRLMGVILKGEYLFVHDEEAMMRGEACTFVYKGNSTRGKLVVSFRCTPAERLKVNAFTVRTVDVAGVNELREYQFRRRYRVTSGTGELRVLPSFMWPFLAANQTVAFWLGPWLKTFLRGLSGPPQFRK